MSISLSDSFLKELLGLCFRSKEMMDVVSTHLKYEYIPAQLRTYKKILKEMVSYYNTNHRLPTYGLISQSLGPDSTSLSLLDEISKTEIPELEDALKSLEKFIKSVRFQDLYKRTADVFKTSEEQAIEMMSKEASDISQFSVKQETDIYEPIFTGFLERQKRRDYLKAKREEIKIKVPFGIDTVDAITKGGTEVGDTDLFMARSGTGKSTYLRWRGITAARRGFKVLHIQAEGTKEKCLEAYDTGWTALDTRTLNFDTVPPQILVKLEKVIDDVTKLGGEVYVQSYEKFGGLSMKHVYQSLQEFQRVTGQSPDLLILDYLELFDPGDGHFYKRDTEGEKYRREASARAFKNICMEFQTRGATATQVDNISPQEYNNPSFKITRTNIAAAKGLIDSFSYAYSWNQTTDEYESNMGRLYIDKLREGKSQGIIYLSTDYDHSRFYDRKSTEKRFPVKSHGKD